MPCRPYAAPSEIISSMIWRAVMPNKKSGPANGANVYFQFKLGRASCSDTVGNTRATANFRARVGIKPTARAVAHPLALDLAGTRSSLSLVCKKQTFPNPAPARSSIRQPGFGGHEISSSREAEHVGSYYPRFTDWRPLGAEIAPYDYTLNTLGVAERRDWPNNALARLLPEIVGERRIVMFAGHRYREFMIDLACAPRD